MSDNISVGNRRWNKLLPDYEQLTKKALAAIARYLPLQGEISVLLTDDEKIRELNKKYRGKDKPTNVLSFPQGEANSLGDIALSLDTLQREAADEEKSLEHHFTHLFVHGVLHLLGQDHETEEEEKKMESLEIKILAELKIPNPYI